MKKVYVVSTLIEGLSAPQIHIFGGRNMAERFVSQMINEHGFYGEDIKVKQYVIMTEDQLTGHYGGKRDA